jgi:hypothetical protein
MNEPVALFDAEGDCLARDNLLIVFFGQRPFAEMVKGAAYCVQTFVEMVPPGVLQWAIVGTTSGTHKPLNEKGIARCQSMLTTSTAKQKDIHFRLMGPQMYGPDYRLVLNGYKRPRKEGFLDQTNSIEMRFPREFLLSKGHDAFADIVKDLFEAFGGDSGYAAPALCVGQEPRRDDAGAYIGPLAMKHHGYDVPTTLFVATDLGQRCRGARWLTLLSHDLVARLGGVETLKGRLASGVSVITGARGVMLRAGQTPEIGDINRKETTPLVASVARAIEPVTMFGDYALLPIFGRTRERVDRWERRFWWQASQEQA